MMKENKLRITKWLKAKDRPCVSRDRSLDTYFYLTRIGCMIREYRREYLNKSISILLVMVFSLGLLVIPYSTYASNKGSFTEFMINPAVIEARSRRGSLKTFAVEITNDSNMLTKSFRLYTSDLTMTKKGTPQFPEAGSTAYSCSNWLRVNPEAITIEPGKSKKFVLKLKVPLSAKPGGYYSAIMCELKERKEETSIGMNVQWRIAVIFKLTVSGSGIIKKAEMGDFLVEKDSKTDSLIFTTTVKNTGNIHFIANGLLVVRDKDNRRVGQAKLVSGKGTVLPESMRDFKAEYKRPLRVGEYTAEAIIRYKGRRSIFKKIPFTVGLTKDIDSTDEIKEDYRIEVASFRLNPKSLDLKIPGGGFRRAAINIANQTELPVKLRIYMSDIKVNSKDSKDSSKYIGQLKNCVVFSPVNLLLMPNKAKKVILNIKIPKNIKGKFNTKLIFEPIDDGKKQGLDSATAELKLNLV